MVALLAALSTGCKAGPPDGDKAQPDAGGQSLVLPQVDAPGSTPLDSVAIRGHATGASRIVIKDSESGESTVNPLLPNGDFCVDTPLAEAATTSFDVIAVAEDGVISDPVTVKVTQDSGAPPPADPTCSDQAACADSEDCGNNNDDDCNGFKDDCDPGCNGCQDDYLEPNDTPFSVPMLLPDTYNGLSICPCREDWYAYLVGPGGSVNTSIQFQSSAIDIDLELYEAASAEMHGAFVANSNSTTDTESINYTSTGGGEYYLRVFSFRSDGMGTYTLTVR
jgi:hypothetical protein